MKIYTKMGDSGETGLLGGSRVPKDHLRIQSYGTLDELNAILGWCTSNPSLDAKIRERLTRIQSEIFQLGAELATPHGQPTKGELINELCVTRLEGEIDEMEQSLPPLKTFILPGGDESSSRLHVARTISRRAERELVTLHRSEGLRSVVMVYVNRMSDYLFVSARYANFQNGIADIPWVSR